MAKQNGTTGTHGGLRSLFTNKGDSDDAKKKAVQAITQEYPFVAEALSGSAADGQSPAISGGSVAIWLDGAVVKFSVSVKSERVSFYGVVADITNPWGSINSALLLGEVSRKRHSEQKHSSEELDKLGIL